VPTQSETNLRILAEMADEIEKYGLTQLPGSLRSLIKTQRGKFVGLILETLSQRLKFTQFANGEDVSHLKNQINGLRYENQNLTELVEQLEDRLSDS